MPSLGAEWDAGSWVEPTILTGLSDEARCVREEIFGPICRGVFDSEEEVIRRANDTDYGLCAAVWTSDLRRGLRGCRNGLWLGLARSWFRDLAPSAAPEPPVSDEGGILVNLQRTQDVCVKL